MTGRLFRAHNAVRTRILLLWPAVFVGAVAVTCLLMAAKTGVEGGPGLFAIYGCGCLLLCYWMLISLPLALMNDRHWAWGAVPVMTAPLLLAIPVALFGWLASCMVTSVAAALIVEIHQAARRRRRERGSLEAVEPGEGAG